jgi:hypothetical protein
VTDQSQAASDVARQLLETAACHEWRGPDAFDGLLHPWPRWIVGGRRRRQAIMQLHVRSPWDIRRLYRRNVHAVNPKALAIYGRVGLRLHHLTADERPLALGLEALELLDSDRSAGEAAWGYPWDMQLRWSFYPAGSPNIVVTAFACTALADAAEAHRRPALLERARKAAHWVSDELWVSNGGFFAYHPYTVEQRPPVNIHNANLFGAWIVWSLLAGDPEAEAQVRRAVNSSLDAQRPDGSWEYGDAPDLGWADSFHTGYVLICLALLSEVDERIEAALERGARAYERFFDDRGRAKLFADREFPEDAHSAGTGMSALSMLVARGYIDSTVLDRVVSRVLSSMVENGHAVHRRYRWLTTTVRYIRWADAHVALGLADSASSLAPQRTTEE